MLQRALNLTDILTWSESYGCESWPVTLKSEPILRMSEKKMLVDYLYLHEGKTQENEENVTKYGLMNRTLLTRGEDTGE
jgi:hypothetical protein